MEQKGVKKDFTVMELRRLKWLYIDGTKKGSTVMELKNFKKLPQGWN